MNCLACAFARCVVACGLAAALVSNVQGGDCSRWIADIGQPGVDGHVSSLTAGPDGNVLATGPFLSVGGVSVNGIARWDGLDWHPLGEVDALVVSAATLANGDVIAGGNFAIADGAPANRIARWDGGNWNPLGAGMNGTVWTILEMPSGDIIAAGTFTTAGGKPVENIARWDGSEWHGLGDGLNGTVNVLQVFDDGNGAALYAGGAFTAAGDVEVSHVARWDGKQWSPVKSGVNGEVRAMHVFDDGCGERLYVAGHFDMAGYIPLFGGIGEWDGQQWRSINSGLDIRVRDMTVFDDGTGAALYAVGDTMTGGAMGRLMKWDGTWWQRIGPPLDGFVNAVTVADVGEGPAMFLGGSFNHAGETPANGIVQYHACPNVPGVTRHVPADYATIQAAIEASEDGDTVLVAPGTYAETINFLGKRLVVQSEKGAQVTVIDAGDHQPGTTVAVSASSNEPAGTLLRGFTIKGNPRDPESSGTGIAVEAASLTVESCIITGHGGADGSGVSMTANADVLMIDCTITDNYSNHWGAGVFMLGNDGARFENCVIAGNTAEQAGGVFIGQTQDPSLPMSRAIFSHCTISGNSSHEGNSGGAVNNFGFGVFQECDFIDNLAPNGFGGALVLASSVTIIQNCRFINNSTIEPQFSTTWPNGAAIFQLYESLLVVEDSQFIGNESEYGAGAIHSQGEVIIADTMFCENTLHHIQGHFEDRGGNTFLPVCGGLVGDLNDDHVVDVTDLLILLGGWGGCYLSMPCAADLDGNGEVDVSDLLVLLAQWG